VIDAGAGPVNTSEGIYCSGCDDLELTNVTVSDTRAGTARMPHAGNFSDPANNNVRISDFRASNCQGSAILGMSVITITRVSIDGKPTRGGK
jgi:hypothetical protein